MKKENTFMNWKRNMEPIDFSVKHNILIANDEDRSIVHPMDEPYFTSTQITPHTWKVYSCGDFTYVVEGENETLVIDSGYGCGNIREYCQSLTKNPIHFIANTHHHFDHTANNYLFDAAYMSAYTYENRSIPFPSFAGLEFPRDYPTVIIDEGYVFDLGGRKLETFAFANHAQGSLGWLDRKERIFFTGDEFMPSRHGCNYSVAHSLAMYKKLLDHKDEFDICCGGFGIVEKDDIIKGYNALKRVLECHEEEWETMQPRPHSDKPLPDLNDNVTVLRQMPRPWDMPKMGAGPDAAYKRNYTLDGFGVTFDIRHIYE
jgi:glyoxylase-like metal-dependent hydrolase (beta-lactamase superfamily II)